NKYTGQFGWKGKHKTVGQKWRWQAEINFARPFTFAHLDPRTVYGNQGLPLAHPLGGNFVETYAEAYFLFPKFNAGIEFFASQQGGIKSMDNYGWDIYRPYNDRPFEFGYKIGSNGSVNRYHLSLVLNYPLSEAYRINAFVKPA